MAMDRYRVKPGDEVHLDRIDPQETAAWDDDKEAAKQRTVELNAKLEKLQELLYAEGKHKVLIVLQAMDAAGKDSSIRRIFDGTNPQGVKVASFKVPTEEERAHDYLWRVHKHTPGAGEIVIFNRSHYEDVLVVRVKGFAPEAVWKKRYDHIRHFEQLLADEGTTILKFFLHISKDEQKERFQDRLDDPTKHWKFRKGDLADRALWDDYMRAYEDALEKTSTDDAPWYVIPANRKWYRDLVVTSILVERLEALNMAFPLPEEGLEDVVIP